MSYAPMMERSSVMQCCWDLRIPAGDWERLLGGFQPREMEDRWVVKAEEPVAFDDDGDNAGGDGDESSKGASKDGGGGSKGLRTVVRVARSWVYKEMLAITVARREAEGTGEVEVVVESMAWDYRLTDADEETPEEERTAAAKDVASRFFFRRLCGCEWNAAALKKTEEEGYGDDEEEVERARRGAGEAEAEGEGEEEEFASGSESESEEGGRRRG